jgi:sugar phosphate isomerase/epimerase
MPKPKVALQLYAVRNECEKDLAATLKAVAAMGYEGVEFAGFHGHSAADVRKMVEDNGLGVAGAHVNLDLLTGPDANATVDFHLALGNKNLIVPWLGDSHRGNADVWLGNAKMFNKLASELSAHGLRTGYHNHNFEFKPIDGADTAWDILAKNTNPDFVLQLDTGNALEGGGVAADYLKRYPNRAHTIHLKEYPDGLIGDGKVDWPAVFGEVSAQDATEWVIVEQEGDLYPPLEYVERWLRKAREFPGFPG